MSVWSVAHYFERWSGWWWMELDVKSAAKPVTAVPDCV